MNGGQKRLYSGQKIGQHDDLQRIIDQQIERSFIANLRQLLFDLVEKPIIGRETTTQNA